MVEVAYAADVAQHCCKDPSPAYCGSGGLHLGAKTALGLPSSSFAMTAAVVGGGGVLAEAGMLGEERVPASPRRQLLRSLIQCRGERKAVREQRSLEIERELLVQLGLDTETASPASGSTSGVAQSAVTCGSAAAAARADCQGSPTSHSSQGGLGSAAFARPSSRSADRPNSARRGGLAGPPRPPKPKPYRPLNLADDCSPASGASGVSAETLPEERRWKSALLPYWPDRQGAVSHPPLGPERGVEIEEQPTTKANESNAIVEEHETIDLSAPAPTVVSSVRQADTAHDDTEDRALRAGTVESQDFTTQPSQHCEQEPTCVAAPAPTTDSSHLHATINTVPKDFGWGSLRSPRSSVVSESPAVETAKRTMDQIKQDQRLDEEAHVEDRKRQLEVSAQRLRDNVQRLRFENRRYRVFGAPASAVAKAFTTNFSAAAKVSVAALSANGEDVAAVPSPNDQASAVETVASAASVLSGVSPEEARRLEDMRQKIAELDKVNELERQRLEEEQREMQERRRQQEAFERGLQEQTERAEREHRAREAQAEAERAEREEEQQRERQERGRRRKEQLAQEAERSKRMQSQFKEGRSEESQQKWQMFEAELDKHWAEQESEERRRVDQYAKDRQRRNEESDRRYASERQKFANAADSAHAARRLRQARSSADADERFYGSRRGRGAQGSAANAPPPVRPPSATLPKAPPPVCSAPALNAEESAVLKELQSLKGAHRDAQKAKVKELLFRWHPDKNPTCIEKATRIFQFVQRQREVILGL